MLSKIRYCEVLDAEVEVLQFERPSRGVGAERPDMICLDVEQRCTRTHVSRLHRLSAGDPGGAGPPPSGSLIPRRQPERPL